jgi:DNA invertase Pin-like site-specific DNA recombinase
MEKNNFVSIIMPVDEWNELRNQVKSIFQRTTKEPDELMTAKEVMERLKIGRTTFDRWILNGTITAERLSPKKYARIYVKRSEFERLLNEGAFNEAQ